VALRAALEVLAVAVVRLAGLLLRAAQAHLGKEMQAGLTHLTLPHHKAHTHQEVGVVLARLDKQAFQQHNQALVVPV
jgi:hypothetical protein